MVAEDQYPAFSRAIKQPQDKRFGTLLPITASRNKVKVDSRPSLTTKERKERTEGAGIATLPLPSGFRILKKPQLPKTSTDQTSLITVAQVQTSEPPASPPVTLIASEVALPEGESFGGREMVYANGTQSISGRSRC